MLTLRTALRSLLRRPAPTAVIIATLAMAIGAATVTYSVVDMMWHALPVADDSRMVFIASTDPRPSQSQAGVYDGLAWTGVSIPDLSDFATRTRTIESFAGFTFGSVTLTGRAEPERLRAVRTTTNLLTAWGLRASAGRGFQPRDGRPGAEPVVMLTDRLWRDRFRASPAAVGRSLTLDGTPHTVVGVLPKAMNDGVFIGTDVALPVMIDPLAARDERRLFLTGLLRAGATREQARADLSAIAAQLQREYPRTNAHTGVVVRPVIEMLGGTISTFMVFLVVIAVALVAIACANIANIVLAVTASRRQEFAVRRSLGASRAAQVTQLITEGLLVSAAACPIGLLLAWTGLKGLTAFDTGPSTELKNAIVLNPRVALAAVTMSFMAMVGFSLLPALVTSRESAADLQLQSRGASAVPSRRRMSHALVAVQIAIAVVLLVQIASLGRGVWSIVNAAHGFDERGVLTFRLDLTSSRYATDDAVGRFASEVVDRIRSLGGVTSAAAINRIPIGDRELGARMALEGTTPLPEDRLPVTVAAVTADYFSVMRIPVARGRHLESDDVARRRFVGLVSETAARRYWPGRDPVGQRITVDSVGDEPIEIVGVTGDVRNSDADQAPAAQVYVPFTVLPSKQMAVVLRTSGADAAQLGPAIRGEVARLDDTQAVFDMRSMSAVLFEDTANSLIMAVIFGAIGLIALCLAAAGVYGLVSYAMQQRTREIGIRMAIGAAPRAVVRLVLMYGIRPVGIGAAIGALGAALLAVVAGAAINEVDFRDPWNYIGVLAALVGIAVVASYLPARRAAHVDPVIALRAE